MPIPTLWSKTEKPPRHPWVSHKIRSMCGAARGISVYIMNAVDSHRRRADGVFCGKKTTAGRLAIRQYYTADSVDTESPNIDFKRLLRRRRNRPSECRYTVVGTLSVGVIPLDFSCM